jgi:hypothetical protein
MLNTMQHSMLALSVALLTAVGAVAQPPAPPPAPPPPVGPPPGVAPPVGTQPGVASPVMPPLPAPVPGPQPFGAAPLPYQPPAPIAVPPDYRPNQDRNGMLLRGDLLLDGTSPSWFFGIGVDIVVPHIKNRLQAPVTIPGVTLDQVHLPTAELDFAGSPSFVLGYHVGQGFGDVEATFRFLDTRGDGFLPLFDGVSDAFLRSNLSMSVIDLDYASRELSLVPNWDMRWKAGVRLANVFFESQAGSLFLEQKTSNNFFGAGPHAGLELARQFPGTGLSLFGRVEGAVLIGRIGQGFEEEVFLTDGTIFGGATRVTATQAVPVLNVQAGVGWTPCWTPRTHWSFGYQFEQWWSLGHAGDSAAELTTQGVFLRGQIDF